MAFSQSRESWLIQTVSVFFFLVLQKSVVFVESRSFLFCNIARVKGAKGASLYHGVCKKLTPGRVPGFSKAVRLLDNGKILWMSHAYVLGLRKQARSSRNCGLKYCLVSYFNQWYLVQSHLKKHGRLSKTTDLIFSRKKNPWFPRTFTVKNKHWTVSPHGSSPKKWFRPPPRIICFRPPGVT